MIGNGVVSIIKKNNCSYPSKEFNFRPSKKYLEYPFEELSSEDNEVYDLVRQALYTLGLDKENYGNEKWNPLKEFINKGDVVLLKPNLVMDSN